MDERQVVTFVDTIMSFNSGTQRAVFAELRRRLFGADDNPSIDEMIRELRESRFDDGLTCPSYHGKSVQRHGFYYARKRGGVASKRGISSEQV